MAFLKGVRCEQCGGNRVWINRYYDEEERKSYVDGATCQVCYKNVVLPSEEYHSFIQKHGEKR